MEEIIHDSLLFCASVLVSNVVAFIIHHLKLKHDNKHYADYHENEQKQEIVKEAPDLHEVQYSNFISSQDYDTLPLYYVKREIALSNKESAVGMEAQKIDRYVVCTEKLSKENLEQLVKGGYASRNDSHPTLQWIIIIVKNQTKRGIQLVGLIPQGADDIIPISNTEQIMIESNSKTAYLFEFRDLPKFICARYQGVRIKYNITADNPPRFISPEVDNEEKRHKFGHDRN